MRKQLTKIIDNNWFFVSLICFVVVMPFSTALVSIISAIILLIALIEDSRHNKITRFKQNHILLWLPVVYLIYIVSAFVSNDLIHSLYDLKKTLFYLVLPLAFLIGKNLLPVQKRYLFYAFSFSVFISSVIAIINWKFAENTATFGVHKASLISHIRFSFQLILVFWFITILLQKNYLQLNHKQKLLFVTAAVYFLSFLLFQQSLTGIIALITSSVFYIIYLIFQTSIVKRILLFTVLVLLISTPVAYVSWIIVDFYDIEKVDPEIIDKKTAQGNPYWHDFENPLVENGRFVYLYVCHEEAREEWNKISEIKYDSISVSGYPVSATLLRYLTSKGLRKDARGVQMLNKKDVENVEKGIANVIYADKKFSLYPRVYQTVWEYYIYTKTGHASHQSFSQRLEFAKAAVHIIKNNFWFGVGTGNWEDEFAQAYVEMNSKLEPELYASSHNQYLNYMVKFGFLGFLLVMFVIVYPVIKTKRYRDLLFSLFLVFVFFANFADSNLESHMGSSFFIFFYCVFLITNGTHYLEMYPVKRSD